MGGMQTKANRQAYAMPESPTRCSSAGLSEEPLTDICNQPHVSPSHSLPLWLMSPPDSIEAIRQKSIELGSDGNISHCPPRVSQSCYN